MSPLGAVCLHGQLARSCAVCELTEELERVRQERDRARQQLGQYLDGECWVAVSEFRRVVEERDEARAEVDLIKVQWQEAAAWREQIHAVAREREEALDARAQALTVLARLERERDEARRIMSLPEVEYTAIPLGASVRLMTDHVLALAQREREALALLRECEWSRSEFGGICPVCGGYDPDDAASPFPHRVGHAADCRLAAALGDKP